MLNFITGLLGHHIGVRIILSDRANASESLKNAGLLIAVDGAELEEAQRKFTVRTASAPEDQVMHRAVHSLEVGELTVIIHGREHPVRIVGKVTRGMEEVFL